MYHTERHQNPIQHSNTSQPSSELNGIEISSQKNVNRKISTLTKMCDLNGEAQIQSSSIKNFKLQSGIELKEARIGFCVFKSNTNTNNENVIVLHPALTGTARAKLEKPSKGSQGDGWWSDCIGSGINPKTNKEYLLNTDLYTVVCFDHFAGRKLSEKHAGSTSASELASLQSKVSLADGVNIASQVLSNNFGIKNVKAVIGGSMGGGQAFEWLFQDDVKVKNIIDISGCSVLNPCARKYFSIHSDFLRDKGNIAQQIKSLTDEITKKLPIARQTEGFATAIKHVLKGFEDYERGRLPIEDNVEKSKLFLVRQLGFILFVTPEFFQLKHERKILPSWLNRHGIGFSKRFDSEGLANLCSMIANAREVKPEKVIEDVRKKRVNIIRTADMKDTLFPIEYQKSFNTELRLGLKGEIEQFSEYYSNDEKTGHDRFLTPSFLNKDAEFLRYKLTKEL